MPPALCACSAAKILRMHFHSRASTLLWATQNANPHNPQPIPNQRRALIDGELFRWNPNWGPGQRRRPLRMLAVDARYLNACDLVWPCRPVLFQRHNSLRRDCVIDRPNGLVKMLKATSEQASCIRRAQPLTVVIKLGTSSIVDEKTHEPLLPILTLIVDTAVKLRKEGHRVVIVSSGAIGVGLRRMDVARRPKHLAQLQALAAIGQCRLISLWDSLFSHLDQPVAQILLTRNDIADRTRYLNAQNTFNELLDIGVIPIVNENDTLAVSEIKFGDNDTLSAITAAMIHADLLFLMTDVDCLYDKNPRTNPDARAIEVVDDIGALEADVSSAGSSLGTGGMMTKIIAAKLGTSAGVTTIITRSSNPGNILGIVNYLYSSPRSSMIEDPEHATPPLSRTASLSLLSTGADLSGPPLHTRFLPSSDPIRDRHFWLLHTPSPHGTVYIDAGAHKALLGKAGLLPVGVVDVEGNFASHEPVRIVVVNRRKTPGPDGKMWDGVPEEIGRALVNYASTEIFRIMGHQSVEIGELLGYADSEYVAHRSHIAFVRNNSRPVSPTLSMAQIS